MSELTVNPLRSLWLREGEVGLSLLTIFVPGGDGSTVEAIGGVMFVVILSINNFYMWGLPSS